MRLSQREILTTSATVLGGCWSGSGVSGRFWLLARAPIVHFVVTRDGPRREARSPAVTALTQRTGGLQSPHYVPSEGDASGHNASTAWTAARSAPSMWQP